ncbi:MAG: hypothetical protein HKO65_09100 [Gemmatimonadetes bacterium]|nr:hypothetical protein [Gemmatimonadota bacterium]NNM05246.1 hypothetical protein [Gemmatimonadota bacterium]
MKRLIGILGLLLLVASCDSGPDGPGDITGTLLTPGVGVGAVVLEVVGSGVQGFSGAGGTKVFWAQQTDPKVHRVVVVGPGGGDLQFQVSVEDRSKRAPRVTVVNVVDTGNRSLPVTNDFKVRFSN